MESFALFIIASVALIITPGPDIMYVLTRGVAGGKRSGMVSGHGRDHGPFGSHHGRRVGACRFVEDLSLRLLDSEDRRRRLPDLSGLSGDKE